MSRYDSKTDTDVEVTRSDGPEAPSPPVGLQRGALVGRYVVLDEIGAGGMGEVFSAYDPKLDRRIALKLVKPGGRENTEGARNRLLREAQALARLSHPNVVAVHDAGTHGDRVFIAMEYVEGQTLREWLEGRSHPWTDVLDLLLRAGRGLAAAHAVGMVHRDFKPANVMVGDDGRVRVLDFGLARQLDEPQADEPEPNASPSPSEDPSISGRISLSTRLTQTGTVMGTPATMAPEQFFCEPVDARTDQFSFCVVAWRALMGIAPFAGDRYEDLARSVSRGTLQSIPKSVRVPRAIRAALRRGLSRVPDDRYPSMDALLADLRRGTGQGRRRLWVVGTLVGTVGLAVAGVALRPDPEAAPPPCQGAQTKLEGIWDPARRAALAEAFTASERPYAEDARSETTRTLDTYAEQWVQLRTEVCEATRVRADQSVELMDLRIQCFDERLRDLGALVDVLTAADAKVVENAAAAALQLPPLDRCTTLDRSASALLDPDDPELAGRVAAARERTASARALMQAGKFDVGLEAATEALERARETGFRPAVAEAAFIAGQSHERLAHPRPTVEAYEQALLAATATGHTRVQTQALIGLASVMSTQLDDHDAAGRYSRHAAALLEHLGNPPDLCGALALFNGNMHFAARDYQRARSEFERAIELTAPLPAAERTHLAALNNLAAAHSNQGHYADAIESLRKGLTIAQARLGPMHPLVANQHNNLGATYVRLERFDEAMRHLREALTVNAATLGEDHPQMGQAHHNLGVIYAKTGDLEAALTSYRRARQIKLASIGPDDPSVAFSANNVGDALLQLHRPDEAVPFFREALGIWTKAHGPEHPNNLYALMSLSEAALVLDQLEEAIPNMRRALQILETAQIDPAEAAEARFIAARVLWRDGAHDEARRLAQQAREGYTSSERPSTKELAAIDDWLANPR